jgi:hypothetical protein
MTAQFMKDTLKMPLSSDEGTFVGRRYNRPSPSFRVGRDVFVGYFLAMRLANGNLLPCRVARAVTNPYPDPGHLN